MANPSKKNPGIENFLEKNFGRTTAITDHTCLKPPLGCGKPITGFRDELSRKEYGISGFCQDCQDSIFGMEEE